MRDQLTLQNLAQQLMTDNARKRDLVVPADCLKMEAGHLQVMDIDSTPDSLKQLIATQGVALPTNDKREVVQFNPTDSCHVQVSEKTGIPIKYYKRMLDGEKHRNLLDANVNYWIDNGGKNHFLRTFTPTDPKGIGIARALLSDKYQVIDHLDVLNAALTVIKKTGIKVDVQGADITDQKMYVRIVAPEIEAEGGKLLDKYKVPGSHDRVQKGIVTGLSFGNSETGQGGFWVAPRLTILACSNGLIIHDDAYRRVHLGDRMDEGVVQWSDDVRQKEMQLIIAKMEQCVSTFLSKNYLEMKVQSLLGYAERKLEHPMDAVTNTARLFSLGDDAQQALLSYFIEGADTSAWGLSQAVTFLAHETADADLSFELEAGGMRVLQEVAVLDRPAKKKE